MYSELIREATNEEMAIYEKVETILDTLTEEEEEDFIETVSNRVFRTFDKTTDKAIYNKVYRLGKKYGLTVEELETWYCIDAYQKKEKGGDFESLRLFLLPLQA